MQKHPNWNLILDFMKSEISKNRRVEIYIGLAEDWYHTAETIYKNGRLIPVDMPWFNSCWATPAIGIVGDDTIFSMTQYEPSETYLEKFDWLLERL